MVDIRMVHRTIPAVTVAAAQARARELVKRKGWGPAFDEAQAKSCAGEDDEDFWGMVLAVLMEWAEGVHPGGPELPAELRAGK